VAQSNTPEAQRAWEAYAVVLLLIFLPVISLLMGYSEVSEQRAHNAFLAQLNGLPTPLVLQLNGSKVDDASRLLADLKRVNLYRGQHAPGQKPKWYRIEIRDGQRTLRLLLARDNASDKYWVYLPRNDSEAFWGSMTDPSLGMRIGGFVDPQLAELLDAHERR
jgi:hypothetical protein